MVRTRRGAGRRIAAGHRQTCLRPTPSAGCQMSWPAHGPWCRRRHPRREALLLKLRGCCMARGRTTSVTIHLTPAERQMLLAWQRSTTLPAGQARRGRIILLVSERRSISEIARTVGISRRFVYKWVQRFHQAGPAGLADKLRPGRRSVLRSHLYESVR